ncbi:MAG: rhomboid family intramembrane serine protease [Flavobacteriaceae bacterium]|nr:rhomboid family intramembrane serine protease [Flavobacteriaceae bacterium]
MILATVFVSLKGFKDQVFFNKYKFEVKSILKGDKIRMFSSGFLHVDYNHLFLNLFTLYIFSNQVIGRVGAINYLIIYIISLYIGNYFSLKFHKKEPFYSAVGASGAVTGIVYSSIILYPEMKLIMLFFPIPLPAYIFGIAYLLYSIYGMNKNLGNIGHTAHFGGAIAGLCMTIIIKPQIVNENFWIIILMISPIVLYLYNLKKKIF